MTCFQYSKSWINWWATKLSRFKAIPSDNSSYSGSINVSELSNPWSRKAFSHCIEITGENKRPKKAKQLWTGKTIQRRIPRDTFCLPRPARKLRRPIKKRLIKGTANRCAFYKEQVTASQWIHLFPGKWKVCFGRREKGNAIYLPIKAILNHSTAWGKLSSS